MVPPWFGLVWFASHEVKQHLYFRPTNHLNTPTSDESCAVATRERAPNQIHHHNHRLNDQNKCWNYKIDKTQGKTSDGDDSVRYSLRASPSHSSSIFIIVTDDVVAFIIYNSVSHSPPHGLAGLCGAPGSVAVDLVLDDVVQAQSLLHRCGRGRGEASGEAVDLYRR